MDNRPIGIFDSGLGGLTTVHELRKIMPNEDIIYFGDTSRVPYGTRSPETILRYSMQDIAFLLSRDVKLIIAACGTASSVIPHDISSSLSVPYIGVPLPAAKAAAAATSSKRIGVIGTAATINSGAYLSALKNIDEAIEVTSCACPLFVPLVENGFTDRGNEVTSLVARQYLEPIKKSGADTLILGCTHYPVIKHIISDILGDAVTLIDSGQEAARHAKILLLESNACRQLDTLGVCSYYVSDTVEHFEANAPTIVGEAVTGHVGRLDIEQY